MGLIRSESPRRAAAGPARSRLHSASAAGAAPGSWERLPSAEGAGRAVGSTWGQQEQPCPTRTGLLCLSASINIHLLSEAGWVYLLFFLGHSV